MNTRTSIQRK